MSEDSIPKTPGEDDDSWCFTEPALFDAANAGNRDAQLIVAIRDGDLEAARQALDGGADMNTQAAVHNPLDLSDMFSYPEILKELLRRGAETDEELNEWTTVTYALRNGDAEMDELLRARGIKMDFAGLSASKPKDIWQAIEWGRLADIQRMIESDPSLLGTTDEQGATPLHQAVLSREYDIVRWLIETGAEVDFVTEDDWITPLHWAAEYGFNKMIEILLDAGADINARIEPEMENHGNGTPLLMALFFSCEDCAKLLIERGADVTVINSLDETALYMCAPYEERLELTRLCIEHGAEINIKDDVGRTPLMMAACNNCAATVEFLLSNGADPTLRDEEGKDARALAKQEKAKEVLKILDAR